MGDNALPEDFKSVTLEEFAKAAIEDLNKVCEDLGNAVTKDGHRDSDPVTFYEQECTPGEDACMVLGSVTKLKSPETSDGIEYICEELDIYEKCKRYTVGDSGFEFEMSGKTPVEGVTFSCVLRASFDDADYDEDGRCMGLCYSLHIYFHAEQPVTKKQRAC